MTYEKLEKSGWLDGSLALETIGIEQMQNDDEFIVFRNDLGDTIAVESMATLKSIYGIQIETWDEVAQAYIQILLNTDVSPTQEEQIAVLKAQNDVLAQTLDTVLTEILPTIMGNQRG